MSWQRSLVSAVGCLQCWYWTNEKREHERDVPAYFFISAHLIFAVLSSRAWQIFSFENAEKSPETAAPPSFDVREDKHKFLKHNQSHLKKNLFEGIKFQ